MGVTRKITKVVTRSLKGVERPFNFEASNLAKFADGSCTCSLGDTSVLVTAVSQSSPLRSEGSSFVPLSVEYKQKSAAAGRIPTTHLRRDVGLSEREILTSRMIDRSIRSSFVKGFNVEAQITCNILAVDGVHDPDVVAINGASASLAISDIPWNGPIGAVRLGLVGNDIVFNPTRKEQENSRLNLVMASNQVGNVLMLDGFTREPLPALDIQKAIKSGVKCCNGVIQSISKLQKSIGKPKRELDFSHYPTEDQRAFAFLKTKDQLEEIFNDHSHDKTSRDVAMKEVQQTLLAEMSERYPDISKYACMEAFSCAIRSVYEKVLESTSTRCDGRRLDALRPIDCQVDCLKPLHGSAVFQRGQTQVLCSTTFDSPDSAYRSDLVTLMMTGVKEKNFMLHYEFPGYATNEISRSSRPGRREIGHGALAENGLRPLVPEDFGMTIRLNCEVLESNGSSSMASVCAGSLSLMDASVPLKQHVAGVAMGLINDTVLTDILGFEDYHGDMDFKIAGTRDAITALQLDVKAPEGLSLANLNIALSKAQAARGKILDKMEAAIQSPREAKDNHPVKKFITVPVHKRARLVGMGGSNLKKLFAETGVKVSESPAGPSSSDGNEKFWVFAPNKEAMAEAEEFITDILENSYKEPELQFNGVYLATIKEIRPTGVMVTLYPNMVPTMLPLSQLDVRQVSHPSVLNLQVGDEIQVKYFGRDPATGQMRLSRKSLQMTSTPHVQI